MSDLWIVPQDTVDIHHKTAKEYFDRSQQEIRVLWSQRYLQQMSAVLAEYFGRQKTHNSRNVSQKSRDNRYISSRRLV